MLRGQHPTDLLQQRIDAPPGLEVRIHIRMPLPIGVHHQHACPLMEFLDHVGQVVAVILAQRGTKHYQIERVPPQRLFHAFASDSGVHMMAGILNGNCVGGDDILIAFAIKDLQLESGLRSTRFR